MSSTERPIVIGIFADRVQAEQAIHELQRAGFPDDQIRYSVSKDGSGIVESLVGLGLSRTEANYYNTEFQTGHTVVVVKTSDRQQEAYDILHLGGATQPSSDVNNSAFENTEQTMQLREEVLQAQKQWVQTGEYRIHKRIITEEKTFTIPVSREEVTIEHIPFNTQDPAATVPNNAAFQTNEEKIVNLLDGETITILVREEHVSFEKKAMVIEEIQIKKQLIQETKQYSDHLRREVARLERTGNVNIQGNAFAEAVAQSQQEE